MNTMSSLSLSRKPARLKLCLKETNRIKVAIKRAAVDNLMYHRSRGNDVTSCVKSPLLGSGCGIQRVEVAVNRADVDHPIDHRGRGTDGTSCVKKPLLG